MGVILATVTNGMVFDITGGVLTAIGILFAGVSLGLQKRKIMRNFKEEIDKGRNKLEKEVTGRLEQYVKDISGKIDSNFDRFDELLANEQKSLTDLDQALEDISSDLHKAENEIREHLAN